MFWVVAGKAYTVCLNRNKTNIESGDLQNEVWELYRKPETEYITTIQNYYRKLSYLGGDITFNTSGSFTATYTGWCFVYFRNYLLTSELELTNIQLEEGSVATSYVPPRDDSITIPDTVELLGHNGVFNTIDDAGKFTKRLDRVTETSDGSGDIDFSGYDYEPGSIAILRNKTTGEVKTLTVSDTIACGWNSVDVEIIYQLDTPATSQLDIDFHDLAYDTLNTLVFTDAKAPMAFSLNNKPLSGYISGTFPFGKKQILQL
mgnify:CR=1 FL=1